MSAAWFCPACQKYHAPHVETCPASVDAISKAVLPDSPFKPSPGSPRLSDLMKGIAGYSDPTIFMQNAIYGVGPAFQ